MNFSVSISVYKHDNYIFFERALKSIYNQTLKPSEVVLVVDGEISLELKKIVEDYLKYHKSTFNVIWLKTNQGHASARMIGLKNCKYNLVALMDSDDVCVENRFEKQIKLFSKDYYSYYNGIHCTCIKRKWKKYII